jgi:hypothetical protein
MPSGGHDTKTGRKGRSIGNTTKCILYKSLTMRRFDVLIIKILMIKTSKTKKLKNF